MIFVLSVGFIFIGFTMFSQKTRESIKAENIMNRAYGLKDISLQNQKGGYKKDFDLYFMAAADEFNIPFALIKSHAIAESSINPKAFLDENPTQDPKKAGWGSRGLCQLLWCDVKTSWLYDRFKSVNYSGDMISQTKGELLFDPQVNTRCAADLIAKNLASCHGHLRDTINMYNTGKKESVFKAPHGYVDKVMNYYLKILGEI